MSQPSPNIAIIGAGPAGCILGRLLHQANIQCTIFEAEESLDFRSQGGTLDLNSGLEAIKAANIYEEYLTYSRFDGSALGLYDKDAKFNIRMPASKYGNPEIDRAELRALLLRSLPDGMVEWKHRLLKVENSTLHFEQGTKSGFDLIVGADGAWSKVRNALTEEKPFFSRVAGYSLVIPNAAETAPAVHDFVNRGSVFSFSDGKSLIAQQLGSGAIDISAWITQDSPPYVTHAPSKEEVLQHYAGWTPKLRDMILASSGEIKCRPLYMLPVGFKWNHKPGVTIIGDAAHLMTPFGGEGVNLALQDALRLANTIIDFKTAGSELSLDTRISAFEEDMFVRGQKAQTMTEKMMQAMLFTAGAPRSSVATWILAKVAYGFSSSVVAPVVYPLLAAVTHSFFFVYKFFV